MIIKVVLIVIYGQIAMSEAPTEEAGVNLVITVYAMYAVSVLSLITAAACFYTMYKKQFGWRVWLGLLFSTISFGIAPFTYVSQ